MLIRSYFKFGTLAACIVVVLLYIFSPKIWFGQEVIYARSYQFTTVEKLKVQVTWFCMLYDLWKLILGRWSRNTTDDSVDVDPLHNFLYHFTTNLGQSLFLLDKNLVECSQLSLCAKILKIPKNLFCLVCCLSWLQILATMYAFVTNLIQIVVFYWVFQSSYIIPPKGWILEILITFSRPVPDVLWKSFLCPWFMKATIGWWMNMKLLIFLHLL